MCKIEMPPFFAQTPPRIPSIPGWTGKGPCESYLDMRRQVIYAVKLKCNWRNGNKISTIDFLIPVVFFEKPFLLQVTFAISAKDKFTLHRLQFVIVY
jgi:hypothetical protein